VFEDKALADEANAAVHKVVDHHEEPKGISHAGASEIEERKSAA